MFCEIALLIFLPFIGTLTGSAGTFFMKNSRKETQKALSSFAAGVMVAACVWSLIVPSVEYSSHMGKLSFVPALSGIAVAVICLSVLDRKILTLKEKISTRKAGLPPDFFMTFFAVTVHNFPEGLAVGIMCAPILCGISESFAPALAFSLAIALQNIPEGAIISLPLKSKGVTKEKAFLWGGASGIVEPVGALITLFITSYVTVALPFLFGFAAGAMLFVVGDELIEKRENEKSYPVPAIAFCGGFSLMMVLDVALSHT